MELNGTKETISIKQLTSTFRNFETHLSESNKHSNDSFKRALEKLNSIEKTLEKKNNILTKSIQLKAYYNWKECAKNHKIFYTKLVGDQTCDMCKKNNLPCSGVCFVCDNYYCFDCFPPYIQSNGKCPLGHVLSKTFAFLENCSICKGKIKFEFNLRDQDCNLNICYECHKRSVKEV